MITWQSQRATLPESPATLAIAELSAHQRAWHVLDEFNRFASLRNP
jgi:hypothetical protein